MYSTLKNRIDKELAPFLDSVDKRYRLKKISPLLYQQLREFVLRDGKRFRPILLLCAYNGYSQATAPKLLDTAIAIELVHDFMLIHDDIIDKSEQRRSKKSAHVALQGKIKNLKKSKFDGTDLAIILGDIMYSLSIEAFMSVKEKPAHKIAALDEFIKTATCTGIGQFSELMLSTRPIDKVTKKDIYHIYDYKTAQYSFAAPLKIGAILAGASKTQTDLIYQFGQQLGIAFQIKDDILGVLGDSRKTGKSTTSDIQESKRTILIYFAFQKSTAKNKRLIKSILNQSKINKADIKTIKDIIINSGADKLARAEIKKLYTNSMAALTRIRLHSQEKQFLQKFARDLISTDEIPLV